MFSSIRWRLALTYLAVVALAMTVLGMFLLDRLTIYAEEHLRQRLCQHTALASEIIARDMSKLDTLEKWQQLVRQLGSYTDARITVIDLDGVVLADSSYGDVANMENHGDRPEVIQAYQRGLGMRQRYSETLKTEMLYVAMPIRIQQRDVGIVRLAMPLRDIGITIGNLRRFVYLAIGLSMLITFAVSALLAGKMAEPIAAVSDAADRLSRGELVGTIEIHATKEINKLVRSFNRMSQQLRSKMEEIIDREERLYAVITTMISGLLFIDVDGVVRLANPAAKQLLKVRKPQENHYVEVLRNSRLSSLVEQCLSSGKRIREEVELHFDGSTRIVEAVLSPVLDLTKHIVGCVVVLHDITDRKRAEQARKDLIANISHELRTPVTAIKGFAETLLEGEQSDTDDRQEFLRIIEKEAGRLQALITDLLELARLEAGQLNINLKKINVIPIVHTAAQAFMARCRKKGIKLQVETDPELPKIEADQLRLEQILTNLLDNACKYTPAGGQIIVSARKLDDEVELAVQDSGIGIAVEHLDRIFERFYRVDKGRSRTSGGTGLGLAIVKHLVEAQQGRILVESRLNAGTRIAVIFTPCTSDS